MGTRDRSDNEVVGIGGNRNHNIIPNSYTLNVGIPASLIMVALRNRADHRERVYLPQNKKKHTKSK